MRFGDVTDALLIDVGLRFMPILAGGDGRSLSQLQTENVYGGVRAGEESIVNPFGMMLRG